MLKTRIIPTLLWKNVGLVKGVRFDSWRRVGTVLPAIRVYNIRDVDELIIVDITATREDRSPDLESIREFTSECFMPMTIGGGIRTVDHIRDLLLAGADKVAINTSLYEVPDLIPQAAQRFGAQCLVASMDAKRMPSGGYECFSHSGTRATGKDPVAFAKHLEEQGAGEILITSIDQDGTMEGFDLELVRQVATAVHIPVIASGGAANGADCLKALRAGADAVAAASIFHFTEQTPLEIRAFLGREGIPVRNSRAEAMASAS